ncbi:hypothetical protein MT325_m684R [Paramecium bursaria chlorella virus MT325]|uniref:Uncharacterized protein m684R n=1 Tax=Paramecium bursaria Chlorella virus MT325 TaxID=346932 RepID=A7IV64_PBCVM|nr:hypothetical protein MT325_m684R [Paramecium bursaria chlorella virus MT325]
MKLSFLQNIKRKASDATLHDPYQFPKAYTARAFEFLTPNLDLLIFCLVSSDAFLPVLEILIFCLASSDAFLPVLEILIFCFVSSVRFKPVLTMLIFFFAS